MFNWATRHTGIFRLYIYASAYGESIMLSGLPSDRPSVVRLSAVRPLTPISQYFCT